MLFRMATKAPVLSLRKASSTSRAGVCLPSLEPIVPLVILALNIPSAAPAFALKQ